MNKTRVIRVILLLLIVVLLLANTNLEKSAKSEIDNKYLAEFPNVDQGLMQFVRNFNTYLTERIGGRSEFIKLNTILNDKLFAYMEHPNYEYGREGYVFPKLTRLDEDYEYLDSLVDYLKKLEDYCVSRDVKFVYLLLPAKYTVYSEYLPEGYELNNKRLEYFQSALIEKGITHVDNTDFFLKLKEKEQIFNVKYDAMHWNNTGAFYGMNNLLEYMAKMDSRIKPNSLDDFSIEYETKHSLLVSEFKIEEEIPVFIDKYSEELEIDLALKEEIEISEKRNFFLQAHHKGNKGINLLSFQGSSFNGLGYPFLMRAVEDFTAVHNYSNIINFDYYFNLFNPNFVIVTTAETVNYSNYFNQDEMNSKFLNPVLKKDEYRQSDRGIGEVEFTKESGNILTKVTFIIPQKIKYGYYVEGDRVFDLIMSGEGDITFTYINEEDLRLDGRLYLNLEDSSKVFTSIN